MHSPVRRCYLHVGLPKTGTSYMQSIIWSSREALEAQGVQLPMHKRADHFQVALALRGLLDETMDSAHAFAALDRLADAVPQLTAPAVLISHEFLAAATKEQADRLVGMFPGFEVHVVITARDLARQVPSAWQQRIKERELHRFEEFVDAVAARAPLADDFWANQDLADVADRWGGAVPPERVHIVTVPRAGGELAQLHERFFSVLGVDPDRLPATAPARNSALGLVQAETLRRVSLALGDRLPHPRAGFGRVGKDYLAKKVLSPRAVRRPACPTVWASGPGRCARSGCRRCSRAGTTSWATPPTWCRTLPATRARSRRSPTPRSPTRPCGRWPPCSTTGSTRCSAASPAAPACGRRPTGSGTSPRSSPTSSGGWHPRTRPVLGSGVCCPGCAGAVAGDRRCAGGA